MKLELIDDTNHLDNTVFEFLKILLIELLYILKYIYIFKVTLVLWGDAAESFVTVAWRESYAWLLPCMAVVFPSVPQLKLSSR